MVKIITFAWVDPKLFEKHGLSIRNNEEMESPDNIANQVAFEQAKVCFEAGLNVMIKRIEDRNIIWVAVDNKSFQQR